jgi:hypothetical protein
MEQGGRHTMSLFLAHPRLKKPLAGFFLWPAFLGGHPSGRCCATLKIAPGNFLSPLFALAFGLRTRTTT